jgi:HPt (histidine-containing phosphotransfer) domain-containing protein
LGPGRRNVLTAWDVNRDPVPLTRADRSGIQVFARSLAEATPSPCKKRIMSFHKRLFGFSRTAEAHSPFRPEALQSTVEPVLDEVTLDSVRDLLGTERAADLLRGLHRQLQAELIDFEATADTLARLRKEAHKLTSAAGMLGFPTLSAACRELELAIDSGADAAAAFVRARAAKASAATRIEALIAA